MKYVGQAVSPNSEILANQNKEAFGGKGVNIGNESLNVKLARGLEGKNYEDVEKNRSVENLNEENSRSEDPGHLNLKPEGKKADRNEKFLEV